MSEAVSMSNGRSMIFSGGVGHATPDAMTASEALKQGGLDWKVALVDAGYRLRGGVFKPSTTGQKAVVRLDEDGTPVQDFGYVKSRFVNIQNDEVFSILDALVDDSGAKFESVWSLYGGRQVGVTMKFPEQTLVGGVDPYDTYLYARTNHDGTGSLQLMTTKVRFYCTNMENVVVRGADRVFRIPHLSNASKKIAAAREALQVTFKYGDAFDREMEKLIQRSIDEATADAVLKQVLTEARFGAVEEKVASIEQLRRESPTLQDEFRNTRYGAFQAFTEWTDWQRAARTPQARAVDLLDGRVKRAKDRAFELLSA